MRYIHMSFAVLLLFLCIGCNTVEVNKETFDLENESTANMEVSVDDKNNMGESVTATDVEESSEIVFDYDNAIELRNADLWLNKKELDKLMLDGKPYIIDSKHLEIDDFSHVSITYPAMILSGDSVIDLENDEKVLVLEDITASLEELWGKEVAVEGYIWYGEVQIEPSNFKFIDNSKYSDDKKFIFVSLHSFLADILDSIVCIYDSEENTLKFIEEPFYGQVADVEYSLSSHHVAYSSYTGGDNVTVQVSVVDYTTMDQLMNVNVNELIVVQEKLKKDQRLNVSLLAMYWEDGKLKVDVEYEDMYDSKNINKLIGLEIW